MIYSLLQQGWSASPPFIPQEWRDGWTVFMPKPNKAATRVENLRVLALQNPLGKAMVKLLTKQALHETLPAICQFPQFAYLPLRSTRDALMRVAKHCVETRQLFRGQVKNIHVISGATSVKSKLLLEDKSWPHLQWCHQTNALVINGKHPSTPMADMIKQVDALIQLCNKDNVVVRFHSLR